MDKSFDFALIKPDESLADFVESFWYLHNYSTDAKEIVVLPDGRVDLFLTQSKEQPFHITLSGLETYPDQVMLAGKTSMFAISFKLTAIEYILKDTVSNLLDDARYLPNDFWGFSAGDLKDFQLFSDKATRKIQSFSPISMDARKQQLFDLIYSSNGMLTVRQLSETAYWSSRQINRYFHHQFGLSLKTYCNILRFRASFSHIKEGKLFPQENFADQSHFIREVKRLSGVSPKQLKQNQNDRFIQFSTLTSK